MLSLLLVEDNSNLRAALKTGLQSTGQVTVDFDCASGEEALAYCLAAGALDAPHARMPDVCLMDVQLAGELNGVGAAVARRREFPRFPVVFYSIQDDDAYYRDFRRSGILSHYAYVRKSNYLLPPMIVPLLRDAVAGRSFIDPDIESRVQAVRHKDEQSPFALLEPNELAVARMLASGLTNEQIAARRGFRDKRTISRTNGQIYAAWGLTRTATDEKIARTRAALIALSGRMMTWDAEGVARVVDEKAQHLPPLAAEVLFYAAREAMRNAARHGRRDETGAPVNLLISAKWHEAPQANGTQGLSLTVEDNGLGLEGAGAQQTADQNVVAERAGSGQGLALHATLLAVVGGRLTVESDPGRFTRVVLYLPAEALDWAK